MYLLQIKVDLKTWQPTQNSFVHKVYVHPAAWVVLGMTSGEKKPFWEIHYMLLYSTMCKFVAVRDFEKKTNKVFFLQSPSQTPHKR